MSWNADQYKLGNTLQQKLALETIKGLLGDTINNKEVLDMGCGTGNISIKMATMFGAKSVHGIDISQSMIDYCNDTYSENNVTFALKNIKNLSATEDYDIITSFFCLHWLDTDSKIQTFAAVHRALRPNGIFLSMGGIRGDHQTKHPLIDAINELLPELKQQYPQINDMTLAELTGYHRLTHHEAIKLLSDSNLRVEHLEHLDIPFKFADKEELKTFIRPLITPSKLFKIIGETDKVFEAISEAVYNKLENGIYMFNTTVVKAIKN